MKFPCVRGNTSRGRRTACTADNSTRELYHGCLGHAGTSSRTRHEVARIFPCATVNSGVGEKMQNTPGKSHVWDSASTPFALSSGKGVEKSDESQNVAKRTTDSVGSRTKICLKRQRLICRSVIRGLEHERLSAITFMRDGMCQKSRQVCPAWQIWRISHERRERSRD